MGEVKNTGMISLNKELTEEAITIINGIFDPNWGGVDIMPLEIEFDDYSEKRISDALEDLVKDLAPLGYVLNGNVKYYGSWDGKCYVKENVVSYCDIEDVGLNEATDETLISMLQDRGYAVRKENKDQITMMKIKELQCPVDTNNFSFFHELAIYANANWKGGCTPAEIAHNAFEWLVEAKTSTHTKPTPAIRSLCDNLYEDIKNGSTEAEYYLDQLKVLVTKGGQI